jgi:hypothetical protein
VEDKLAGLSRAAGKQGTEYGNIKAAFHGSENHLHVGRYLPIFATVV